MSTMTPARSGLRSFRLSRSASILGIFFVFSSVALHSFQWDREGARLALEKALTLQAEISGIPEPTKNQYLNCIKSYRLVYMKDPHFHGSDDAIYASGLLYEEMGNRFGEPGDYRRAAKLFKFLISDYDTSPFRPDALLRLGNLYADQLADNDAAQDAYNTLRTRYKNSKAALSIGSSVNAAPKTKNPKPTESVASENDLAKPHSPISTREQSPIIHGIRFWTTDEYTRIVIDMDAQARYNRARISNPDRIYFDIWNAKFSSDLLAKTIEVGDEFVKRVRLGRNQTDVVRVVLDLETVKNYSVSELHDPFRIMIDVHGSRPAQARIQQLANESNPRPDEVSPEKPKGEQESPVKPVIQQQALNVPKEVVKPSAAAITGGQIEAKKTEIAHSPAAESASFSGTTASKSATSTLSAAKEPATNPSADSSQSLAKATSKLPVEAKAPETGMQVSAIKSAPLNTLKQTMENSADKAVGLAQTPSKIEETARSAAKAASAEPPVSSPKSSPAVKPAEIAETTASKPVDVPPAAKPPALPAPKAAAPTSRGDRTLTRMLGLKVGRIVIDPGHGGHDTGTIGRGGLMEKDLTLELAKKLHQLLASGLNVDVVLTREEDVFLSLEERTAIANQHQADLFISIHANSSSARSTSGVETYFLDFARNAAAREIAARENATSFGNVRDLEDLIKRIAQADKSAESRELASVVQKKLFRGARQLLPSTHNRGVRSAPFVVLIGANMPSVLAEVAFISNPRDESMLKKKESQEQLAKALFAGIEDYMKTLGSDVAQNQVRIN